jgi:hypothetical protein
VACVTAGALRLFGYAAQGLAVRHPAAFVVLYLIPLLGGAAAALEISGIDLLPLQFFRRDMPEPAR